MSPEWVKEENRRLEKDLNETKDILIKKIQSALVDEETDARGKERIEYIVKKLIKNLEDKDETLFWINIADLKTCTSIDEGRLNIVSDAKRYFVNVSKLNNNNQLIDSGILHIKGTILITDPCYICKERESVGNYPKESDFLSYQSESHYPDYEKVSIEELDETEKLLFKCGIYNGFRSKSYQEDFTRYQKARDKYRKENISDWERCGFGTDMKALGINHYLCRDTLYGDWSCTTYDVDTGEPIGHFCADAGMVGVFLLDEVLAYNPDYDYKNKFMACVIKDFEGDIQIIVECCTGTYEEDSVYHKKGETWTDYEVRVTGTGSVNFISKQTGF